jgi:hypothetical protein
MNFSFLGANIPILFVGSQSVSVEVRIIWYQSQVLKSGLLSFYLLFVVIILSCSVCVHYSLFLLLSYFVPFVFIIPCSFYHHILFRLFSLFLILVLFRAPS